MPALEELTENRIAIRELKGILDRKFFASDPGSQADREIMGELDLALAEFDMGLRDEAAVVAVASRLLQNARRQRRSEPSSPWASFGYLQTCVQVNLIVAPTSAFSGQYSLRFAGVQGGPCEGEQVVLTNSGTVDYYYPLLGTAPEPMH